MITIQKVITNFENEPLMHPFGFKGGAMSSIWQYSVHMQAADGASATGVGCQGVLWSDSSVFAAHSPSAGSAMMYLITEYAAKLLEGMTFSTPPEAFDRILPPTVEYAKQVTGRADLRLTFVLNALVGVDHALWQLYEQEQGHRGLDHIIPSEIRPVLSCRYDRISVIPLVSYGVTMAEVRALAEDGFFFFKIKIGSDPDQDGDPDKMLAWDKKRLREIHSELKDVRTPYTESGYVAYYLDANGRYDTVERIEELLAYAKEIGMLERIVLLEEPFPEENECSVKHLPVLVAADESAHSPADVRRRIEQGYGAIALKPIAKTLTVTFRMIAEAMKSDIPCFCADLTVGPYMVEVNKAIASRLKCLPGLKLPVVESNGWQNYKNWELMCTYHAGGQESWARMERGGYDLNTDFYKRSGGMFEESSYYKSLAIRA